MKPRLKETWLLVWLDQTPGLAQIFGCYDDLYSEMPCSYFASFLPAWLFLDTGQSWYGGGVSGVCPDQSR